MPLPRMAADSEPSAEELPQPKSCKESEKLAEEFRRETSLAHVSWHAFLSLCELLAEHLWYPGAV